MKRCKCEHWQQCPVCMPHRFDGEGKLLPPEPTPLQAARNECESLRELLAQAEINFALEHDDKLELEQQLATSQKREVMLREALERFALIDLRFETLPETFAFDVLGARKALTATEADLGGLILCDGKPVGGLTICGKYERVYRARWPE